MKIKKQLTLCVFVVSCLWNAAGQSKIRNSSPADELQLPLEGISELIISYDEENLSFFESTNNKLIVKEYMTVNRRGYYAKTDRRGTSLKISEGGKPFFKGGFTRSVEVYLPASYSKKLTVTTTNGDIDFSGISAALSSLRIDSTSGSVRLVEVTAADAYISSADGTLLLDNLESRRMRIETTNGTIICRRPKGVVSCVSTHGNITVESAEGEGCYSIHNSGVLDVSYAAVTGDISFFNKNGPVKVIVPSDLAFVFKASAKNGTIKTDFQNSLTFSGRTAVGTVGSHPVVTVEGETNNGSMEFFRQMSSVQ
jgi:lia operon protein LiaG